jgi:hypothetical protein
MQIVGSVFSHHPIVVFLALFLFHLLLSWSHLQFSCSIFCAYKSRRLLFNSTFCSGDIAALRALSSSRLRFFDTWQYCQWNWMHLQHLYIIKKSTISNKMQKGMYCKNFNSLLRCNEWQLGCPIHFFFSNR